MRNEFQAYLLQVGKEDKTVDNCTLVTKHKPTHLFFRVSGILRQIPKAVDR